LTYADRVGLPVASELIEAQEGIRSVIRF